MWSDANQASGSIASKGTGARHDSLNHLFQHWNWKKTTGIVSLLCRKLPQSAQSSVEQRAQWEELNEIIDVSVRQKWSELPTVPYDEGKKTRSVYVLSKTAGLLVTQALKALRDLEEQDAQEAEQISAAFSTADWIAEGLTIEEVQERLRRDIKERGTTPTSGQALEIGRRRQQLQDRIKQHCNDACLIYTPEQLAQYLQTHEAAEDPDVVGRPELTKLALPSRISLFCSHPGTSHDSRVIEAERSLRRASCLQSLQRVRTTSQQKALLLSNKKKNACGEVKNTRLQTMVSRLTARVELAAWEYNNSYDALLALGATKDDKARLQRLRKEHLAGLTSMLQAD
ncbi:hypothetical protein FRC07_001831 [Ceratobasidium sp. 392]|nr:hypothetical protein FRC07_001831 [Ceratobasidium sp. 392]